MCRCVSVLETAALQHCLVTQLFTFSSLLVSLPALPAMPLYLFAVFRFRIRNLLMVAIVVQYFI